MEYSYRQLGKEDVALYREMLMLFKAEVPPDEQLQALLAGSPESLQIVALEGETVVGAITAVESGMTGQQPDLYVSGIAVREGYSESESEAIRRELMEELKHVAHLWGVGSIYLTYHGDNRDVSVHVPPLRPHCKITCQTRTSPTHCLNRAKHI